MGQAPGHFDELLERGGAERHEFGDAHFERRGDSNERRERRNDHAALKLGDVPATELRLLDERIERVVTLRAQAFHALAKGSRDGHRLLSVRVRPPGLGAGVGGSVGRCRCLRHCAAQTLGEPRVGAVRSFEQSGAS